MEYVTPEQNQSQYKGQKFEYGQITDAIYVHAQSPSDRGNRYIEALPVPPDSATVIMLNSRNIPGYIRDASDKTDLQKLTEINKLDEIRVPLPSDYNLWITIYTCLEESYSRRKFLKSAMHSKRTIIGSQHVPVNGELIGDEGAAVIGFNMIGESGCGKTSALKIDLDYYPKVIRHTNDDGSKTIQIPYILVTCPPNSNFRVLYQNIGRQLDRYLGNEKHECENLILGSRRSTLGEMLSRVEEMINLYAIGMIVFDEVQLMNFTRAENSFSSLMTMANETNVVIGLVGTSEAISNITKVEQIARRVGYQIPIDSYTTDETYFNLIFKAISRYQWFDRRIQFTDLMKHEIFMESHGVIAYIILIYTMICKDYVMSPEKPEITVNYIKNVISRNFSTIREALHKNYATGRERELALAREISNVRSHLNQDIQGRIEAEGRNAAAAQIASDSSDEAQFKLDVINQIKSIFGNDYNDDHINHCYDIIRARHPDYDVQKMSAAVTRRLVQGNTDRRRTAGGNAPNAVKTDLMSAYLNDCVGDPNDPLNS